MVKVVLVSFKLMVSPPPRIKDCHMSGRASHMRHIVKSTSRDVMRRDHTVSRTLTGKRKRSAVISRVVDSHSFLYPPEQMTENCRVMADLPIVEDCRKRRYNADHTSLYFFL